MFATTRTVLATCTLLLSTQVGFSGEKPHEGKKAVGFRSFVYEPGDRVELSVITTAFERFDKKPARNRELEIKATGTFVESGAGKLPRKPEDLLLKFSSVRMYYHVNGREDKGPEAQGIRKHFKELVLRLRRQKDGSITFPTKAETARMGSYGAMIASCLLPRLPADQAAAPPSLHACVQDTAESPNEISTGRQKTLCLFLGQVDVSDLVGGLGNGQKLNAWKYTMHGANTVDSVSQVVYVPVKSRKVLYSQVITRRSLGRARRRDTVVDTCSVLISARKAALSSPPSSDSLEGVLRALRKKKPAEASDLLVAIARKLRGPCSQEERLSIQRAAAELLRSKDVSEVAIGLRLTSVLADSSLMVNVLQAWKLHRENGKVVSACVAALSSATEKRVWKEMKKRHPDRPMDKMSSAAVQASAAIAEQCGQDPLKWQKYWYPAEAQKTFK